MSAHTPGPWDAAPWSSVVGGGVFAQPDPKKNQVLLAQVRSTHADSVLMAAAPVGLAAAVLALDWIHDPDENATARFERIAFDFYRDTGFSRPGKDVPASAYGPADDKRAAEFEKWCAKRSREVRAALSAFVAQARGEPQKLDPKAVAEHWSTKAVKP